MNNQETINQRTTSLLEVISTDTKQTNTLNQSLILNKTNKLETPTNISLISKEEFKNQQDCQVCYISFGRIKVKQHHCRLCANSVCDLCSKNQINGSRVCDICFVKAFNIKQEKKRYELLQLLKEHLKQLNNFAKAYQKKLQKLDNENINEIQKLDAEKMQLQTQKEKYQLSLDSINMEVNEIKGKNQIIEQQLASQVNSLKIQQEKLDKKKNDHQNLMREIQKKEQQLQIKQKQFQILIDEHNELSHSKTLMNFHTFGGNEPVTAVDNNSQSIQSQEVVPQAYHYQSVDDGQISREDIQQIRKSSGKKKTRSVDLKPMEEPFCKEKKCVIM